ncbi:MAG TPA: regulatory iron-sulfur-containing complex subunit RicT [Desulfovibrio sp.]|jgi:cell fate regulator YaaT (PSP1 superfamily)|uniref:PSP1 domain-containing protein n=1 Tax=Desulfovibrio TaxID=872 RepID=UPI0004182887|nr:MULTISPECIES: regulatory iron-sulfur-containing complex subunit RicT [Desulfovibrio]MDY0306883.1 regulatory iron-sulfur-containing complex subunit RicT [Desulfovibrionaceae bacterium]HMM37194.1 regulatory iron-sulfur-containing complex subunit RicT [Desulfovibrio sp.]
MSQILGVKFNDYGQVYYFTSGPFVVQAGQSVIVRTEQGMGLGTVIDVRPGEVSAEGEEQDSEIKPIYRLANEEDLRSAAENERLARDAYRFCRDCIRRLSLDMKLVDVEVHFDRGKMIFYFTAPGRIDFRELIKDLVREYRTRIELRQIGVRHETQMLGAIGNCGQLCCCRRFLRKFAPVTIKMAKEQNLFLNPTKISGICGRLLCCLSYEQQGYEEFHKQCPKIGKKYQTTLGQVKILRSNFFKKTLTLWVEGLEEKEIPLEQWQQISKKGQQQAEERQEPASRPEAAQAEGEILDEPVDALAEEGEAPRESGADGTEEPRRGKPRKRRRSRRPGRGPKPEES